MKKIVVFLSVSFMFIISGINIVINMNAISEKKFTNEIKLLKLINVARGTEIPPEEYEEKVVEEETATCDLRCCLDIQCSGYEHCYYEVYYDSTDCIGEGDVDCTMSCTMTGTSSDNCPGYCVGILDEGCSGGC